MRRGANAPFLARLPLFFKTLGPSYFFQTIFTCYEFYIILNGGARSDNRNTMGGQRCGAGLRRWGVFKDYINPIYNKTAGGVGHEQAAFLYSKMCVIQRMFLTSFFQWKWVFCGVFLSERKACDFLIRFSLFISFKKCDLLRKAVFKMVEISSLFCVCDVSHFLLLQIYVFTSFPVNFSSLEMSFQVDERVEVLIKNIV